MVPKKIDELTRVNQTKETEQIELPEEFNLIREGERLVQIQIGVNNPKSSFYPKNTIACLDRIECGYRERSNKPTSMVDTKLTYVNIGDYYKNIKFELDVEKSLYKKSVDKVKQYAKSLTDEVKYAYLVVKSALTPKMLRA